MGSPKQTLRELIETLSKTEKVPPRFVESVIAMVEQKGIDLNGDAAPWAEIITKSFKSRAETHKVCMELLSQVKSVTADLESLRDRCLLAAERARKIEERMVQVSAELRRQRAAQEQQKQEKESRPFLMLVPANLLPN
ncbi:MAG: hypothetical protein ACT4TC_15590 [Myxococcaceae bacterium]